MNQPTVTHETITAEPDRLYTVADAAAVLAKSQFTIRQWLRSSKLRGEKIRVRQGDGWTVTRDWRIVGTEILNCLGDDLRNIAADAKRRRPESASSIRKRALACLA